MRLWYKKNPDLIFIGQLNTNLVISDSLDTNIYEDITSIENWNIYAKELGKDILYIRERIRTELNTKTWSSCSSIEKDIIIEYYLKETLKSESTANTEKVMYLMSKGYSLQQSQFMLINAYSKYHIKEITACTARANSPKLYDIIGKYLSIESAADLIKVTHKLFDLYKSQAIRGTTFGTAGEGLLDFIQSTPGTAYEFTGLEQQGYTLLSGTWASFVNELLDVLQHGNY